MRSGTADAGLRAIRALEDPEGEKHRQEAKVVFDPANLEVFLTWMAMGGMQHPPGISELEQWPSTKRHDYLFFIATYYRIKERHDQDRAS